MKTSCIVLASLVMTVSANAQFSYGAKKKTTPDKSQQDTVIAKPVTKPVTNNQVLAAPTISEVKPTKNIDTTVVGGFNANNKRSLRNGYAFFSETNSRKGMKERMPLPYENLREEDALFSEFVWEEIDAREKINRTFMYQSYDENGDQRFFAVLLRAIEKDGVVPFSTVDDRFTTPISLDDVNASLKGSLDTQLVQNVLDPNVYDTSIIYNTNLAPNPDSIYTFRLKEQWIFDSKTSRMYSRIIGIAPIAAIQIGNKVIDTDNTIPLISLQNQELEFKTSFTTDEKILINISAIKLNNIPINEFKYYNKRMVTNNNGLKIINGKLV